MATKKKAEGNPRRPGFDLGSFVEAAQRGQLGVRSTTIIAANEAAKHIENGFFAREHVGAVADGLNEALKRLANAWATRFAVSASVDIPDGDDQDHERELSFRRREKNWAIVLDTIEAGSDAVVSSIPLEDAPLALRILAARQLGALESELEHTRSRTAQDLVEVYENTMDRLHRNLSPAADAK